MTPHLILADSFGFPPTGIWLCTVGRDAGEVGTRYRHAFCEDAKPGEPPTVARIDNVPVRLLQPASVLRDIVLVSYLAFGVCPLPASAQTDAPFQHVDSLAAAADRGEADAQYEYGRLFELGADGIAIDYDTAFEWYARAAEQGHIPAMLSLSTMLLGSDPNEAMRVVLRAAELGSAEAQWRAGQVSSGRIFLPVSGIDQDREAALGWFKLAADQGHHPSAEALADLYTDTEDPSDYAEAIELYRRAADSGGSAWAGLRLGMIHAIGEGVEESDRAAREWFSKLGSGLDLDPDRFSDLDLEVLGGLQAYYGLDFLRGETEPDPALAIESFKRALEPVEDLLSTPFMHSSFLRTSKGMLRKLEN